MGTHKGTFHVTGWDEQPYEAQEGVAKLTKARFTTQFTGDIEGESVSDCLMCYPDDSSAKFVGLQWIKGTVGGKAGTVVLQLNGSFEQGKAKADWSVVPESGSGELAGLAGSGHYVAGSDGSADYQLSVKKG